MTAKLLRLEEFFEAQMEMLPEWQAALQAMAKYQG
jgi:hypothetical protein